MNVYFVCTGNTCRSPMAEAILKSKNIENLDVRSAGISAFDGGSISPNAAQTLAIHGIPQQHQSHSVTLENLHWADLVLTMTVAHRNALQSMFPQFEDKIYTLKEFVSPSSTPNISDPFGGDISVYLETFEDLNQAIDLLVEKIVEGLV